MQSICVNLCHLWLKIAVAYPPAMPNLKTSVHPASPEPAQAFFLIILLILFILSPVHPLNSVLPLSCRTEKQETG